MGRLLFGLFAIATMAIAVSACGGGGANGTVTLETGSKVSASCEGAPTRGGELTYARQYETVTLNPLALKNGNGDIFSDELIYSGLVRLDPQGGEKIEPALAESWDISADGKTYTFHLRPGIKFSDGTPITAEDVRWSLENFANPRVNEIMAVLATGFERAKVIDPETVQVKLKKPVAAFLYNIAEWPAVILPKKLVEEEGDAFWAHPVGAGPFEVEQFTQGSHLTLDRNPYYWEKDKPYLDSVRFNFAVDSGSRVLSLRSGEDQMADGIPFSQIAALQGDSKLAVQTVEVPAWIMLSLNHKVKPLSELDVRQAMEYALDREEINQAVFKGVGKIPNSLFGTLVYDDTSAKPYEYDPAKGKELMAESKFPDGFSITLQYPAGFDFYKPLTLIVQQDWKAIGIDVKLEEVAAATAPERWTSLDFEASIPYPTQTSDVPVPDEYAGFYADPESGTNGLFTNWRDPAITKKVLKFQSSTSEAERAREWPVIQRELMEQSPAINVMTLPLVNAHQTDVCGTAVNRVGVDRLEFTWLANNAGR